MKRIAIKLVLFLLLGAIINVAVAWGCGQWSESEILVTRQIEDDEWRRLIAQCPPGFDSSEFENLRKVRSGFVNDVEGFGITWRQFKLDSDILFQSITRLSFDRRGKMPLGGSANYDVQHASSGWPERSLSSEIWYHASTPQGPSTVDPPVIRGGWLLEPAASFGHPRVISWRPLWPGFAINTIFCAAALWFIFAIPGVVKRLRRRAKGRCIHCGYDLRGQTAESKKCPECGLTPESSSQRGDARSLRA
jgi:hypothetical protein